MTCFCSTFFSCIFIYFLFPFIYSSGGIVSCISFLYMSSIFYCLYPYLTSPCFLFLSFFFIFLFIMSISLYYWFVCTMGCVCFIARILISFLYLRKFFWWRSWRKSFLNLGKIFLMAFGTKKSFLNLRKVFVTNANKNHS